MGEDILLQVELKSVREDMLETVVMRETVGNWGETPLRVDVPLQTAMLNAAAAYVCSVGAEPWPRIVQRTLVATSVVE